MTVIYAIEAFLNLDRVIAILTLIVAGIAAYYAYRAPDKRDLKRVEEHTAATSRHLENQNERSSSDDEFAALIHKAYRVPITVCGTADSGQPLTIYLRTNDPTVLFSRIELLNDMGSHYGKAGCSRTTNSMEFGFTLEADAVMHWLSGSTPIGSDTHLGMQVRSEEHTSE